MDITNIMGNHQTASLQQMSLRRKTKVIAISGGKGGIGKTNITVNLAIAMANRQKRVMIFDADLGLGNVDVLLGLNIQKNLSHVLSGEVDLADIITPGPSGIKVIPASSGIQAMSELSALEQSGIIQAFDDITYDTDILLIDTAAGISSDVVSFVRAAEEVIMVVCNEPTSLTDSYASMKVLSRDYGIHKFYILTNMVDNNYEGQKLFNKLHCVTERFIDVNLSFLGSIPFDDCLRKSVQKQQAVINAYPGSKSATAFNAICEKLLKSQFTNHTAGSISFFLEQLIQDEVLI